MFLPDGRRRKMREGEVVARRVGETLGVEDGGAHDQCNGIREMLPVQCVSDLRPLVLEVVVEAVAEVVEEVTVEVLLGAEECLRCLMWLLTRRSFQVRLVPWQVLGLSS